MGRKIIFFDADGTIVKGNKISDLTKEAFKKLKEKGYILVLCTGRAIPALHGPLQELNFENMICSAGGTVIVNNKIVYTNPMSMESKKELIEFFDSHGVLYNIESNDYIWINKGQKERYLSLVEPPKKGIVPKEDYENAVKRRETMANRTKETDNPTELNINKIHWYEAEMLYGEKPVPISYEYVNDIFKDKYNVVKLSLGKVFSGGEISESGVTKSAGMKVILDYFNIDKEDIYAIGDDYNDADMLKFATHSTAMGHAPEEIKELCEYITKDIDHDGLYYAMKKYNLI